MKLCVCVFLSVSVWRSRESHGAAEIGCTVWHSGKVKSASEIPRYLFIRFFLNGKDGTLHNLRNCCSSQNRCQPPAETKAHMLQLILELLCCSKLNSKQFCPCHKYCYVGLLALNLCLWDHKIHVVPVVRFYHWQWLLICAHQLPF